MECNNNVDLEKYYIWKCKPKYNIRIIPYKKEISTDCHNWQDYSILSTKNEKIIADKIHDIVKEYYKKYQRNIGSDRTDYQSYLEGYIGDPRLNDEQIHMILDFDGLCNSYDNICLKFHYIPYKEYYDWW